MSPATVCERMTTAPQCIDNADDASTQAVRERVEIKLQASIQRLSPPLRLIAGYQLGFWDETGDAGSPAIGKRVRSTLVALSAQAVGAGVEQAMPAAVAVELVHAFSLLHDDIMDRDQLRRGRRSGWVAFGVPAAMLAGDALLALSLQVLAEAPAPAGPLALRWLHDALQDMASGQFADLELERERDATIAQSLETSRAKTASLIACSCAMGALLGGADDTAITRLRTFGRHLGIAFQLTDDLLGIRGDSRKTGKPVTADVQRRKKSLPIITALNAEGPARDALVALYHLPRPLTADELARAVECVEEAGGLNLAQFELHRHIRLALEAVSSPELDCPSLRRFAERMLERDA